MTELEHWKMLRLQLVSDDANEEEDYWRRRGRTSGVMPDLSLGHPASHAGGQPSKSDSERLAAVASGSQAAMVKVASYGGGTRFNAMVRYVSRNAGISVEDDRGRVLKDAIDMAGLVDDWADLFDHRQESRDVAAFEMVIDPLEEGSGPDLGVVQHKLQAALGDRKYAYSLSEGVGGRILVSGVTVLRDANGHRLSGDDDASNFISGRLSTAGVHGASFKFNAYGNGVEYGTAQVRRLVRTSDSAVRDETGRLIKDEAEAGMLVQQTWRPCLHSRRGRDLMHVVMSARAGTDPAAFEAAARDFLAEQFAGHRYVFSKHDPFTDTKEEGEGGKRPHIHVHAIISTKDRSGKRLRTNPKVFTAWRKLMAEKARDHGIEMEATDRREFASPAAYSKNQVRAVNTVGRTEYEGTSAAAHRRYIAKRNGYPVLASSPRSLEVSKSAIKLWKEIAVSSPEDQVREYALERLKEMEISFEAATKFKRHQNFDHSNLISNLDTLLQTIKEGQDMDFETLTRQQFDDRQKLISEAKTTAEAELKKQGLDPAVILKDVYARIDDLMADYQAIAEANEERQKRTMSIRAAAVQASNVQADKETPEPEKSDGVDVAEKTGFEKPAESTGPVVDDKSKQQAQVDASEKVDVPVATAPAAEVIRDETAPIAAKADGREATPFPEGFQKRYYIDNRNNTDRVYADAKGNIELFQATDNRLRAKLFDERAVSLMLDTAAHRGWTSIEVKGSKEFRREAWLEGQARGISVMGYQPTELDRQEVAKREVNFLVNEIAPIAERTVPIIQAETSQAQDKTPEAAIVQTSTKRPNIKEGIQGELVEIGSRPYQDRKDAEKTPYAVVNLGQEKMTLWGVGLPDALDKANARIGDVVELREAGMEKVTKSIIKEIEGEKVSTEVEVDRRKWEATVVRERTEENKNQPKADISVVKQAEKNDSRTNEVQKEQPSSRLEQLQRNATERNKDDLER